MEQSKDATEIKGVIEYINANLIWVKYSFKGESYRIELPRTKTNEHFVKGDKIEMQMFILVEKDNYIEEPEDAYKMRKEDY